MKKFIQKYISRGRVPFCIILSTLLFTLVGCVDNDDMAEGEGTFYTATKRTAAQIIGDDADRCSMFQAVLEKANYYSLLSVYGNYTVSCQQMRLSQSS